MACSLAMGRDMREYVSLPPDAASSCHQYDEENRITSNELEQVIVPVCGHIEGLQKDVGQQVSDCLPTFTALLEYSPNSAAQLASDFPIGSDHSEVGQLSTALMISSMIDFFCLQHYQAASHVVSFPEKETVAASSTRNTNELMRGILLEHLPIQTV
ncbi:hypothetical protein N7527_010380 [Penicillium freii]|nr:hypothetical protein N7527_010380 [Penicillium freii]